MIRQSYLERDSPSTRLNFAEFSALLEMADVVLDPFPVGGGRSSFEIFAVGTPIVMLYNRTSVLQVRADAACIGSCLPDFPLDSTIIPEAPGAWRVRCCLRVFYA